eukprot:2580522-Pyramimonas_sp.AAC.2
MVRATLIPIGFPHFRWQSKALRVFQNIIIQNRVATLAERNVIIYANAWLRLESSEARSCLVFEGEHRRASNAQSTY